MWQYVFFSFFDLDIDQYLNSAYMHVRVFHDVAVISVSLDHQITSVPVDHSIMAVKINV